MRLIEIIDIERTLAKNGLAKCDGRYTDTGILQRCLCPDSNVRIGEYWYEEYITDFGWSILYKREENIDQIEKVEHPITEDVLYVPPTFKFVRIASYAEVIGARNVLIEFIKERGIYYQYALRSSCIPMHPQMKTKRYPNPNDQVIVYVIQNK